MARSQAGLPEDDVSFSRDLHLMGSDSCEEEEEEEEEGMCTHVLHCVLCVEEEEEEEEEVMCYMCIVMHCVEEEEEVMCYMYTRVRVCTACCVLLLSPRLY